MHRFGFDVTRWPHRPDDGVLDWALDAVLRSREINCVIDVGGNRGHFAERLRALGYRGRIVSFEPSPSTLPVITAAAAKDGRWEVRPLGLSAAPGTAELRLHEGPELDSLLTSMPGVVDQIPIMAETGTATVSLSTLEAELPSIVAGVDSPRVLLKSDTQGHDAAVLRGAGPGGLPPSVVAVLVELAAQPIYTRPAEDDRGDGHPAGRRVHAGGLPAAVPVVRRAADGGDRRAVHAVGHRAA